MTGNAALVVLTLGALSASLALLAAHLRLGIVADILAITSGLCGLTAFVGAAVHTVRRARQLPRPQRPT
jgi:hypothetical protein